MKTQWIITSGIIYQGGKVLVVKRADTKKFLPGVWEIPGGRVEWGETVEEALKREIKEELAINIKPLKPIHCFTYYPEAEVHATEIDYLVEFTDSDQEIKLNIEDHSDMKWVDATEIDELFNKDDQNYIAVKAAFEWLGVNK